MGLSTDREPDSGVLGATGDAATKRLVFCFDGTTNTLDTRYSTNVVKLTQSLSPMAKGVAQLIYYDKGVGTDEGEKLKGSAFGFGMDNGSREPFPEGAPRWFLLEPSQDSRSCEWTDGASRSEHKRQAPVAWLTSGPNARRAVYR